LSALFLANKLENDIRVESRLEGDHRIYELHGQIFFSSSEKFMQGFDFKEDIHNIVIDLTHAHIWDVTSVAMLDSVINKFKTNVSHVTVRGLNEASTYMIDKYGIHAKI
jgi:sulfate permease, SulP family